MPKLTLLVGPPGSGKTTYANEVIHSGDRVVYVNQDSQGKQHLQNFNAAIAEQRNIVVDRLNFVVGQRNRYLDPARAAGYETEIVVLHESLETCMRRMRSRTDHPTITDETSARKAAAMFFKEYERVQDSEADVVKRLWPSQPKELALIVDLDGTLCNIDHRQHLVTGDKKNWKWFFEGLKDDTPNKWCVEIIERFQDWHAIVFCSGRPDDHQNATVEWLVKHDIKFDHLFMRQRGDFRQDSVVKEIILDFEILTRYNPYFAIDDRDQVVQMWRSRGLTCLQCAEGDF